MVPKNYDVTELDSAVIIEIGGDLEMTTIKDFKEWILNYAREKSKDIILDFSKVDYLDSTGISLLINLSKLLQIKKKKLQLTKLSKKISLILELTSLVDDLEQNNIRFK
jgi:anti-sigma B factor antagonist